MEKRLIKLPLKEYEEAESVLVEWWDFTSSAGSQNINEAIEIPKIVTLVIKKRTLPIESLYLIGLLSSASIC